MLSANDIRQQFLDFFTTKCGHTFVPSSPVVPFDDPTLLFANAGMNQFKDVFLGTGTRPYKRAVNTQKCIRAGGKHNDLDDVGKDTYHHTFFEMLGNWSFGDYFKEEAIAWAWELLTQVWKMDPDRLHVTVFEGDGDKAGGVPRDEEAADIWHKKAGVPKDRIHYGNKKDNFWEMGETGPCGPCTEIHIDRTPDKSGGKLVNAGVPEVMEIWNLVFIQYNRNADKSLTPLPAKHVDTGMGFERVTAVLQGKDSNYDTDVFTPLFKAIQDVTKAPNYTGDLKNIKDIAYRVIADHIRTLTFAITDGGIPSNDGRGGVLRSVLRRASRYGWQHLNMKNPFLHKLVPDVIEQFGDFFPELKLNPEKVREIIFDEERSFLKNLEKAISRYRQISLPQARESDPKRITGNEAFVLHDTYGLNIEILDQMAAEDNVVVDREAFEVFMVMAREKAREARKKITTAAIQGTLPTTDDSFKFSTNEIDAEVVGWVQGHTVFTDGKLLAGDRVAILLDRTNFYAEQGGQTGDTGQLTSEEGAYFTVDDTQRLGDAVLHLGELKEGRLRVGERLSVVPATMRRFDVMRNHTATHLLNLALRRVLGSHVDQKGSLVDDEKTRFDFSHTKPLTADEIRKVEEEVSARIAENLTVTARTMPLAEAKKLPGVRAMFGEKYPDPVRVVMISDNPDQPGFDDSIEFCGGTHLDSTGTIGIFKIISQEGTAKGVRRVTAITGRAALQHLENLTTIVDDLAAKFNCSVEDLPGRVESLQLQLKELMLRVQKAAAGDMQATAENLLHGAIVVKGSKIIVGEMPAGTEDALRQQLDSLRQKAGSAIVVIGWKIDDANVGLLAAVTDDLIPRGIKAGELVGKVAEICGGKGGGRPNMARAGGKLPAKLPEALNSAVEWCRSKLS